MKVTDLIKQLTVNYKAAGEFEVKIASDGEWNMIGDVDMAWDGMPIKALVLFPVNAKYND